MTHREPDASALRGPLDGIRVLDLTNMLSGPYCTRLLADLGAEVIKIEPIHGDHNRGRRPVREGHSSFFGHLNCGKKSVVLNLKTAAGNEAALAIARQSDVVVENWRPGVAERLGVGYEAVRALKADIVYCSISGFGQTGPSARRPAYAPIIHAASGFDLAQVGYQGGGKPQNTATYTADVFGGMSAFAAIQAALFHRSRTGDGQYIDVALLGGMLNILVAECQEWQAPTNAKHRVYPPVVNPKLPVHNVQELIALAKTKSLNYGVPGLGGPGHLGGVMFNAMTGTNATHIPYAGGAPTLMGVVRGDVDFMFTTMLSGMPLVKSGRVRAIAVTSAERSPLVPELPTMSEAGLKGFELVTWYGIITRGGTPKAIVDQLARDIDAVVKEPALAAQLAAEGTQVIASGPDKFGAYLDAEVKKWAGIVKQANIQPE